jgi:hypothetical protein
MFHTGNNLFAAVLSQRLGLIGSHDAFNTEQRREQKDVLDGLGVLDAFNTEQEGRKKRMSLMVGRVLASCLSSRM